MSDSSEGLLQSAWMQWDTVKRLMQLVPKGHPARKSVIQNAESCQIIVEERRSRTPMDSNPHASEEGLALVLDEVVNEEDIEATAS